MPIQLSVFERWILFRAHLGPGPMVDALSCLGFKACVTALRLGVFRAIDTSALTADEIAAAVEGDPRGVGILLEALTALGYVKSRGDRYENTAMTRRWLLPSGTTDLTEMFFQFDDMSKRWDNLDESIKKGSPSLVGWEWLDAHEGSWAHYLDGLGSAARLMEKEIIAGAHLPAEAERLLDLGGGHGMYSVLFCKHHPALRATVLDWDKARSVAEANIAHEGMTGRVTFQGGDFLEDDLAGHQDVILLFNVIRIFPPDELKKLFLKVRAALAPGGLLLILDHLGGKPRTPFVKANSELILLELFNSTAGRTHSAASISGWLAEMGFAPVKTISLRRSPGLGMVRAIKSRV